MLRLGSGLECTDLGVVFYHRESEAGLQFELQSFVLAKPKIDTLAYLFFHY